MNIRSVFLDKNRGILLSLVLCILSAAALLGIFNVTSVFFRELLSPTVKELNILPKEAGIFISVLVLLFALVNAFIITKLWFWKKWAYILMIGIYCVLPAFAITFGFLFNIELGHNEPKSSDWAFLGGILLSLLIIFIALYQKRTQFK